MTRIADTFAHCKTEKRAAFIPFIMGGDPNLETCVHLLDTLAGAGADIIELGIPFSDPMADGPVIEAAGNRALAAGTTLTTILDIARIFRAKHSTTPLVLMGYLNPIYIYGYENFARDARAAGVDGIIIVDLPPEEAHELEPALTEHHIALVRLIAPTSVPDRLPLLTKGASGYLYYISITGITGAGAASSAEVDKQIAAIRAVTDLPISVGFGIKTPEDVAKFAPLADGVVVGSSLVKLIAEHRGDTAILHDTVRALADACKVA